MKVLKAAWFLIQMGNRLDRRRLRRAVVLMIAGYVAAPFAAVGLSDLTNDLVGHHDTSALFSAIFVAVMLVAALMCGHFAHLDYFELAELQQSDLRIELAGLVNGPPQVAHLDDPEFADNAALVKDSLFSGTRAMEAVLALGGLLLQTTITAVILINLDPWLALLPLFAIPPVLLGKHAQATLERSRDACAEQVRLNHHLLTLATSSSSVKEVRLFGAEKELERRQKQAWDVVTHHMWLGQIRSASLRAIGQIVFAIGYSASILVVVRQAVDGHTGVGGLILVIALAVQVSAQVSGALSQLAQLQTAGRTVERIEWLRQRAGLPGPNRVADHFAAASTGTNNESPTRIHNSIRIDGVTFAYPGSGRVVLDDITLDIEAGTTLALVGENGAGKSTLVKILCQLYSPSKGRVLVDDVDLATIASKDWRLHVSTLFQDFFRLELTLKESVGIGDLDYLDHEERILAAISNARADAIKDLLPGGLAGFVGRSYGDGVDISAPR